MGCGSIAYESIVYGYMGCGYTVCRYIGCGLVGPINIPLDNGVVAWILNSCYS